MQQSRPRDAAVSPTARAFRAGPASRLRRPTAYWRETARFLHNRLPNGPGRSGIGTGPASLFDWIVRAQSGEGEAPSELTSLPVPARTDDVGARLAGALPAVRANSLPAPARTEPHLPAAGTALDRMDLGDTAMKDVRRRYRIASGLLLLGLGFGMLGDLRAGPIAGRVRATAAARRRNRRLHHLPRPRPRRRWTARGPGSRPCRRAGAAIAQDPERRAARAAEAEDSMASDVPPARVYVAKEPPPPIAERRSGDRPGPGAVWTAGNWEWDPDGDRFVWAAGSWRVPPAGTVWVAGRWMHDAGGWYWVPGACGRRAESRGRRREPARLADQRAARRTAGRHAATGARPRLLLRPGPLQPDGGRRSPGLGPRLLVRGAARLGLDPGPMGPPPGRLGLPRRPLDARPGRGRRRRARPDPVPPPRPPQSERHRDHTRSDHRRGG